MRFLISIWAILWIHALNENFDITYKRVSNRLRLLSKLREYLTPDAASKIYESMILPILAYNTMIKPVFTDTQQMRLESIESVQMKLSDMG